MQTIESRPSEVSNKLMSKANSELLLILLLLFPKITKTVTKNCPKNRVKRDSIEFERSENIGQFCLFWAFSYFLNAFNAFK